VIATAKPDDEQRLRELGAAETIDCTRQDIADLIRERHPDGVNAPIDFVNGPTTSRPSPISSATAASSVGAAVWPDATSPRRT
jgi:NADPH:quinone reductase-like Zn-dependent oxidoreductase